MVPSAPRLLKKDRIILEKGEWLNDRIINGAQKLLKRQFPSIDGLHSTISVAANQADILRGGAIQILHVHGNHWLCTKIGEDKSEVKIFDSLYPTIRLSLVDQLMIRSCFTQTRKKSVSTPCISSNKLGCQTVEFML